MFGGFIAVTAVLAILALFVILLKGMVKTVKRKAGLAVICIIFLAPIWVIWSIVELFTSNIDHKLGGQRPTEMMYIGTWLVASFVAGTLYSVADLFLAAMIVEGLDNFHAYLILNPIIFALIFVSAIIFTYNNFDALSVRRVFPWLVVIYGLGALLLVWLVTKIDANPAIPCISIIISFLAMFYAIRAYYINKPDRWY